jgi:hypothetical protein
VDFKFHHVALELWFPTNATTFVTCNGSGEDPNCRYSLKKEDKGIRTAREKEKREEEGEKEERRGEDKLSDFVLSLTSASDSLDAYDVSDHVTYLGYFLHTPGAC